MEKRRKTIWIQKDNESKVYRVGQEGLRNNITEKQFMYNNRDDLKSTLKGYKRGI